MPELPKGKQSKGKPQTKGVQVKFADDFKIVINDRQTIEVANGNLLLEKVDAIVNPAKNRELTHGWGLAGRIATAGGPKIQKESTEYVEKHGWVAEGDVVVTTGGDLSCSHVLHVAGPFKGKQFAKSSKEFECREILANCVKNLLTKANSLGKIKSISIPAISVGTYGFEKEVCADVMIKSCVEWLHVQGKSSNLESIRLCDQDEATTKIFKQKITALYR